MEIPLDAFEQYIDEPILKRGLSYFKKDYVEEPQEISPGKYMAVVHGTEDYIVKLTLKNNIVTEYVCNCPYDMGPVCKHEVAVIFYLLQDELKLKKNASAGKKRKTAKRKTISDKINELLEKVSHEELKQFMRVVTAENIPVRNKLFASFTQYIAGESKSSYAKHVKSILRTAIKQHGYIDWNASRYVGSAVGDLLDTAQKQFENQNYKSAIYICTAVMEPLTEALQYADDSNGELSGSIDFACDMLYNIANEGPNEEIRKLLIDYCISAFDKEIYEGWDWHTGMLDLASLLVKTEEEAEQILSRIGELQKSEYEREVGQGIRYNVLLKIRGEEEADRFLEQHLANADFRRQAIEKALKNREFGKAVEIAKDGINHDLKNKPGLAMEWNDWLLKIALAQADTEKIILYGRYLFIDNFRNDQDYYQILKKHVDPDNWNSFLEEVIKDIKTKKRWPDTHLIASIYIKEAWWDRLLELVRQSPDLMTLDHYEKYLKKEYPGELAEMYAEAVISYLENNIGRDHYQKACRYLRRMIKLDAREKAGKVIAFLRTTYPKRRALMEELNNI